MTVDSWRRGQGLRIVTLQRALLLLGSPDLVWEPLKDDDNPPRFYEPLPSGPYKGKTTDRDQVVIRRAAYFETTGWDERGIPTTETLNRLGLGDVDKAMSKLR